MQALDLLIALHLRIGDDDSFSSHVTSVWRKFITSSRPSSDYAYRINSVHQMLQRQHKTFPVVLHSFQLFNRSRLLDFTKTAMK